MTSMILRNIVLTRYFNASLVQPCNRALLDSGYTASVLPDAYAYALEGFQT